MSAAKSLDALRREIDRIDDQIHDLIMRRTRIVEKVKLAKTGEHIKIRPGREDEILYRLMARHAGAFPKRELTRIWREMIIATLSLEGPFSVAVQGEGGAHGCWDLARDHYGASTPMVAYPSARRVIEAVRSLNATVGILPLPRRDDAEPWWPHLVTDSAGAPRVIARLPFAGPAVGHEGPVEALAICPVTREPTSRERTLFAVETEEEPGLGGVEAALRKAGLPTTFTAAWREPDSRGPWLYLVEIDGAVGTEERVLVRFTEALGMPVNRIVGLGGYGTPLGPEDLAPKPVRAARQATRTPRKRAAATARRTPQASRKRRS